MLPELVTRLAHVDLAAAARLSGWMLATFAVTQFFAGPSAPRSADGGR